MGLVQTSTDQALGDVAKPKPPNRDGSITPIRFIDFI